MGWNSMGPIDRRKSAAWTDVNVTGLGKEERPLKGGRESTERERDPSKIADCRTRAHFLTKRAQTKKRSTVLQKFHSQSAFVDFWDAEPESEWDRRDWRKPSSLPSSVPDRLSRLVFPFPMH